MFIISIKVGFGYFENIYSKSPAEATTVIANINCRPLSVVYVI